MNHDQINWIIKDIQGLIPREKRRRADERGLKDRKPEKDDLGFESDKEYDFVTLDPEEDEDSSDGEELPNQHIKVKRNLDMQQYYDPKIVKETNNQLDKKIKFDKMLHAIDEKKQGERFDDSKYPKFDFEENKYELFATIDQNEEGRFVAYVLK